MEKEGCHDRYRYYSGGRDWDCYDRDDCYGRRRRASGVAIAGLATAIPAAAIAVGDWIKGKRHHQEEGHRGPQFAGGYGSGWGGYGYGAPCGGYGPWGNRERVDSPQQTVIVAQKDEDDSHNRGRGGRGYERDFDYGYGRREECCFVTQKEAHLTRELAEKDSRIAGLLADKYTDNKVEHLAEKLACKIEKVEEKLECQMEKEEGKLYGRINKVEECLERKICKVDEEAERRSDFLNEKFTKGHDYLLEKYGALRGDLNVEVANRKCCCEKEEMARKWGDELEAERRCGGLKLEAERRECCCKELKADIKCSTEFEAERRRCADELEAERRFESDKRIYDFIECHCAKTHKKISPRDICPPVELRRFADEVEREDNRRCCRREDRREHGNHRGNEGGE